MPLGVDANSPALVNELVYGYARVCLLFPPSQMIVFIHEMFCPKMIVLLPEPFCPKLFVMFMCYSLNDMFHHQEDFRHWARNLEVPTQIFRESKSSS